MGVRRLDELRAEVRNLSDSEAKLQRHPDADVTFYVNQSLQRLQELVSRNGHGYYLTSSVTGPFVLPSVGTPRQEFTFAAGGRIYVFMLGDGDEFWQLDDLQQTEIAYWRAQQPGRPLVFRLLSADQIAPEMVFEVYPAPDKAYTWEMWVLPEFIPLVADADEFSDHFGWSEWATSDAAQKICIKDKDNERFALLAAKKLELEQKISEAAPKQQRLRPVRRRDTRSNRLRDGYAGRGR